MLQAIWMPGTSTAVSCLYTHHVICDSKTPEQYQFRPLRNKQSASPTGKDPSNKTTPSCSLSTCSSSTWLSAGDTMVNKVKSPLFLVKDAPIGNFKGEKT